jgi:ABC-type glycerol-3-phosphate transport system substrate-binding protein
MFDQNEGKRMMNRRDFLRMGSMATGVALLAACAPTAPGAPQAAPADDGAAAAPAAADAVVVEAWAHWEQGLQWLEDALKNYGWAEEHPNITMNKVVAPFAEIHDKMLAACASGVGVPDIMRVEQGRASAFFKGDEICFVDMTDLIGERINDLVLGSAVDYWSWKGAIYGIGNEVNACTLAYRKSVFDELGVTTPFETWDALMEAGVALKEARDMAVISFHDLHDGDFQMMLFAAGGQMFDENGDFGGANELGMEILEYQRRLMHELEIAVPAPVTGDSTWSPPIYWEAFRQEQIATALGAPWHNGKLGNDDKIGPGPQEGQWRLQRLPAGIGTGVPTATHGGTSVSIPKMAQHKDEAWMIIEETHLTEAVLEDVKQRGITPSYKPVLTDPMLNEPYAYYDGQVIGELYLELSEDMPRIYQSPWAPEFHTAFQNIVLTPVLQDNNQDYEALFGELEVELQRIKSL